MVSPASEPRPADDHVEGLSQKNVPSPKIELAASLVFTGNYGISSGRGQFEVKGNFAELVYGSDSKEVQFELLLAPRYSASTEPMPYQRGRVSFGLPHERLGFLGYEPQLQFKTPPAVGLTATVHFPNRTEAQLELPAGVGLRPTWSKYLEDNQLVSGDVMPSKAITVRIVLQAKASE